MTVYLIVNLETEETLELFVHGKPQWSHTHADRITEREVAEEIAEALRDSNYRVEIIEGMAQ